MATLSPGIYVREFDFSEYVEQIGGTTLAVLGGATKGPVGTPTLVLSEGDLVRRFGPPVNTNLGLQAAVQYLKRGRRVLFTRVGDDNPITGVRTADAKLMGGAKAVGSVVFNAKPVDGATLTVAPALPTLTLRNDAVGASGNVPVIVGGTSPAALSVAGMAGGTTAVRATGSIIFSANPAAGTTVLIGDGTTSATFTFGPGGGEVPVGVSAAVTAANLLTAINAHAINVTATNITPGVTFEFDSDGSVGVGNVAVDLGISAVSQFVVMARLINAINANAVFGPVAVVATDGSTTVPRANLMASLAGVVGNASLSVNAAAAPDVTIVTLAGGLDAGNSHLVTVSGKTPGTWANGVRVDVVEYRPAGVPASVPTAARSLLVYASTDSTSPATLTERYDDFSLDPASPRFIEVMLARGIGGEVAASEYIRADVYPIGPGATVPAGVLDPVSVQLGRADLGNTVGQDGIDGLDQFDFIGTVNGQVATGLQALRNPETTEFNLLCIPGISHRSVITAAIDLCRSRGDAVYLIDPPLGMTVESVVDWHNGLYALDADAPTSPLDDSYAALFWPWLEVDDPYTKKTLWLPPSGFVAGAMAESDDANGEWWAVAGFVRGKVSANRSEYSPSPAERDLLVGGQNRVNPIVAFQGRGLRIFGNRTSQRANTALNSLHIRRMLIVAEKTCATATQVLLFNPNDPQTWKQFRMLCESELNRIKAGRGIERFSVICDEATNPPSQRAQKIMRGKLLIVPVEAAEVIRLDFAHLLDRDR